MAGRLRVLLLFDMAIPPPQDQRGYLEFFWDEDWFTVRDTRKALTQLGHQVHLLGLFDNISPLLQTIESFQPDVVFNVCESFKNDRKFEPQIAGTLELLGIPFTGAPMSSLFICKDKKMTKDIAARSGIRIPQAEGPWKTKPSAISSQFPFPAIVKPLNHEASEGLTHRSVVKSQAQAIRQITSLQHQLRCPVLLEEFITGREIYISVIEKEDGNLKVLPSRELVFQKIGSPLRRFANFNAKWSDAFRERWGIRNQFTEGLPTLTTKVLEQASKKLFRELELRGFARFDFRIHATSGIPYFLEANPNPSIAAQDDFAKSFCRDDASYAEMIQAILNAALTSTSAQKPNLKKKAAPTNGGNSL